MNGAIRKAADFTASDVIGVAIARHARGHHLGVLYAGEHGEFLLHQAFECVFVRESPCPRYLWIPVGWPVERLQQVSNLCDELWRRYGKNAPEKLRYAFAYHEGRFALDGGAFIANGGKGLTCATFVMALFASVGLKLIVASEWPAGRPGDDEMLAWIVEEVGKRDRAHAEAIASERGCVRYRPEEVAGGAMHRPHPAGFHAAVANGATIATAVTACDPL